MGLDSASVYRNRFRSAARTKINPELTKSFELCNKADQELSNRIERDKVAARAQNFHYSLECLQTK